MSDPTHQPHAVGATVTGTRGRVERTDRVDRADSGERARSGGRSDLVRIGDRSVGDGSRTSPRMRFDLLQLAAWAVGLALVVAGLVAVARAGFGNRALFEPVVEVGGQAATPLYALLWLVTGLAILAAGTGTVAERRLRIGGVVLAVAGVVFLIEPAAFAEYLGTDADSGTLLVGVGALLSATSFVPPLSVARPGIRGDR